MKKGEKRKQELVGAISAFILENGIEAATLRNIADAVGTSDRMLMHYFEDKETLFTVTLTAITDNFITILDSSRTTKRPIQELIPYLHEMMKHPEIKPYVDLCVELISLASRKEEPFYTVGRQMAATFLGAITRELAVEDTSTSNEAVMEQQRLAALTLVLVEGIVFLRALGYDEQISLALDAIKKLK